MEQINADRACVQVFAKISALDISICLKLKMKKTCLPYPVPVNYKQFEKIKPCKWFI